ncbi:MAG: amidase domain-containing protein [Eubacterium sp.]|nr:amidase domain-containing protein [Eubacterium sp.]
MKTIEYNREAAVSYAERWALRRNPNYYDFDGIGGDCTNFASQCLYAGSEVMNYTKDVGWYYNSPFDRAAAWSGAQYFYNFMVRNESVGPTAVIEKIENLQIGDFIQLHDGIEFYHTLIITGFSGSEPLISAHTADAYMRPLGTYTFAKPHGLHITGVNVW